jgi:hypothetical protein|tara:strand:- start:182 stop:442 length:261 start_codon:yes stop_codon:yes gene_type:complete
MKVKLTEKELIDLITDIVNRVGLKTDNESELGEQEAGTSSAGEGTGTAAMTKWESGIARGVGNQIGVTMDQSGYTAIGRGKANPVW